MYVSSNVNVTKQVQPKNSLLKCQFFIVFKSNLAHIDFILNMISPPTLKKYFKLSLTVKPVLHVEDKPLRYRVSIPYYIYNKS